mmetsp:Transcript_24654/g.43825  ORF Transcript_24654/g.43825 Transcript_24654/m.43825 type:complete len:204 (+) Transcript_24654:39-650(+)
MQFKTLAFLALIALASATTTNSTAGAECHPECKWQCDDPACPAVCHPVCERPKCEISCEETPCAKCTIHCERPICSVRCPKDMCEMEGCPKCETVCSPAKCHTKCVAPEPKCNPVCEETKCDWKCKKPTTCPKPKCELQCEKPECATTPKCCECTAAGNAAAAFAKAGSSAPEDSVIPSFLEVMDTLRHSRQQGEKMCCPCKA